MTVTLTPDIETRFRTYAEDLDLNPEQLAANLLTRAFEEAEAELKETMDGLDRSVEDYNAGRWMTSEEHDRRMEALAVATRAKRDGSSLEEAKAARKARLGEAVLAQ